MSPSRSLRTVVLAVLSLCAAACMGSVFPTEVPPTPGAAPAQGAVATGSASVGQAPRATNASRKPIAH